MSDEKEFEFINPQISDEVIITMAGIATTSVKGVTLVRTGVAEGITSIFSRNSYSKGIKVDVNENTVVIDIYISVEYGRNINEIAREVQAAVKKEIENMTDMTVASVNINIININLEKPSEIEISELNKETN
jgi:uncharacterized alkaline shock family protein YloU